SVSCTCQPSRDASNAMRAVAVPGPIRDFSCSSFLTLVRSTTAPFRTSQYAIWRAPRSSPTLRMTSLPSVPSLRAFCAFEHAGVCEHARKVPVHPALASILDAWWLGGFEFTYCRKPTLDDFIVPRTRDGLPHTRSSAYKLWLRACAAADVDN